jgi:hypothetical protein
MTGESTNFEYSIEDIIEPTTAIVYFSVDMNADGSGQITLYTPVFEYRKFVDKSGISQSYLAMFVVTLTPESNTIGIQVFCTGDEVKNGQLVILIEE